MEQSVMNVQLDGEFDLKEFLPWFRRSTSWGMDGPRDTIFFRHYALEWLGYKVEILRQIDAETWRRVRN